MVAKTRAGWLLGLLYQFGLALDWKLQESITADEESLMFNPGHNSLAEDHLTLRSKELLYDTVVIV